MVRGSFARARSRLLRASGSYAWQCFTFRVTNPGGRRKRSGSLTASPPLSPRGSFFFRGTACRLLLFHSRRRARLQSREGGADRLLACLLARQRARSRTRACVLATSLRRLLRSFSNLYSLFSIQPAAVSSASRNAPTPHTAPIKSRPQRAKTQTQQRAKTLFSSPTRSRFRGRLAVPKIGLYKVIRCWRLTLDGQTKLVRDTMFCD